MASFNAGTTFSDGVANDVTAAKLGTLITAATPTSGFIQDRTAETAVATDDTFIIGDASDSNNLKRMTVANVMKAEHTGTINSTSGTIQTLTSSTATITGGTFSGSVNSTTGTIATFNSTTGTIPTLVATTLITTGTGTATAPAISPTGDSNNGLFFPAADTIAATTNGTERVRVDSSGNVGIGTTSPSTKLHIDSASVEQYAQFNTTHVNGGYLSFNSSGTVLGDIGSGKSTVAGTATDFGINARGARNLVLGTNNTERLRIDSSGNVGIGVTTGTIAGDAGPLMVSSTSAVPILAARSGDGNVMRFYRSGTQVGSINLTSGATAYVTSSDYRLKTNLEQISNGIDRIKQLPVYRFNWIADQNASKVDGFVAHEVKEIVPEAITGDKDAVDADGKPIYQGIDQSKIVPLLTAALKEAIAKIETLESKVAALEAV